MPGCPPTRSARCWTWCGAGPCTRPRTSCASPSATRPRTVGKVLRSAVANAENNDELDPEELYVAACFADEGTTIKRWRPRARGRATRIRKRTSHITVIVGRMPQEELQRLQARRRAEQLAQRARRVAGARRAEGDRRSAGRAPARRCRPGGARGGAARGSPSPRRPSPRRRPGGLPRLKPTGIEDADGRARGEPRRSLRPEASDGRRSRRRRAPAPSAERRDTGPCSHRAEPTGGEARLRK